MSDAHLGLPVSSAHPLPFHFTIRPTLGAAGKPADIAGEGGGGPPAVKTCWAGSIVVWFPDSKTETKTRAPEESRASARGCFARILITCGTVDGDAGSKTLTSLGPETQMKANSFC